MKRFGSITQPQGCRVCFMRKYNTSGSKTLPETPRFLFQGTKDHMCIYGYEGSGVSFQYKSFLGWGSVDYRILTKCYFWVWKNNLAQVKQVSQDRKKRRKKYNFKRWCMWCCKRRGLRKWLKKKNPFPRKSRHHTEFIWGKDVFLSLLWIIISLPITVK